mgnify:CR=1 FL=1
MPDGDIVVQADFLASGWARWLPRSARGLNMLLATAGVDGDDPLSPPPGSTSAALLDQLGGMAAPAWALDEDLIAEARDPASRAALRAGLDRRRELLAPLGLGSGASMGDLLNLMLALGLATWSADDGDPPVVRTVDPLPLPAERLPLTPEEAAREDDLRWRALTQPVAERIAALLAGEQVDVLVTSLERLAVRLGCDPDDVRQGLAGLVDADGGLEASRPPEALLPGESFELHRRRGAS